MFWWGRRFRERKEFLSVGYFVGSIEGNCCGSEDRGVGNCGGYLLFFFFFEGFCSMRRLFSSMGIFYRLSFGGR